MDSNITPYIYLATAVKSQIATGPLRHMYNATCTVTGEYSCMYLLHNYVSICLLEWFVCREFSFKYSIKCSRLSIHTLYLIIIVHD